MQNMTDEKLNELNKREQWYKAAIEAATDEKTKAGLEKLMEYTSDAIDLELFDRMGKFDCGTGEVYCDEGIAALENSTNAVQDDVLAASERSRA